jgi:hypothetical protein
MERRRSIARGSLGCPSGPLRVSWSLDLQTNVAKLPTPKGRLETITLGHLLDQEFPVREDLIAPWLRQGESAMIWAPSGAGKTLLTLTLAVMVAGGGEVLGWRGPRPRKVLVVDGEMAAEDLQERARWLIETVEGIDREAARDNLHILSRNWQDAEVSFPDLGDRDGKNGKPSGQDVVFRAAQRVGTALVLLDNFATLSEVSDENDAAAMTPTPAFLLRLKPARMGCILVHHSGKTGETYRGSSRLATTFKVTMELRPVESEATTAGAAFVVSWDKYRRKPCEAVQRREVRLENDAEGRTAWVAKPTEDDDMRRLVTAVQSCRFRTQRLVAEALKWDASKVTRMKTAAIRRGMTTERDWKLCLEQIPFILARIRRR